MKKLLLSAVLCTAAVSAGRAQIAYTNLEAGNIRSVVGTTGHMWWDKATGMSRCEYPKGSGKHIGFAGGMWVGGYDTQSQLMVAANTYAQSGSDFWPGAISASGISTPAMQTQWNFLWKVTRAHLDTFFSTTTHTMANTPQAILRWPAKGNTLAVGATGSPLAELTTTPYEYAPFVDFNGDGIYNPLAGDYPKLRGDEMVWQMYNDAGGTKPSGTDALSVQVGMLAWAYHRGTTADNVQFYEYSINNRGGQKDSTVVGIFADLDLGYGSDDYMGFDSTRRMGYNYNGASTDGPAGSAGSYGSQIPISGVVLLRTEGDIPSAGTRVPAGAFTYFNNSTGPAALQDPTNGVEFYRFMTGSNKAGYPFVRDFTGSAGVPTTGSGNGTATRYVFDGDPAVSGTWSECYSGNAPGDRRFVLSSKSFRLLAGETYVVAMALVVSPNAGGCPSVTLGGIKQTADTAIKLYDNPPAYVPPTPTSLVSAPTSASLKLFPNPAEDQLFVQFNALQPAARAEVFDAAGRKTSAFIERSANGFIITTATLPRGLYAVRIIGEDGRSTAATFVKQ